MAIITISRGTMSGGEALASALSQRLGWPSISREVITDAAREHGVSEQLVAEQLTKGPGLLRQYTAERRLYLLAVESALLQRALQGSYIYHGYAGHLLLKGIPGVLKVRLIAPLEYRIRNVIERKGLSRQEGLRHIQEVDKQRAQWTQFLYNLDWTHPSNYDLVCNLVSLSIECVAGMICRIITSREFEDSPEMRAALEQANLACRIKTVLAQHEATRGMDLDVAVKDKTATVTGTLVTSALLRSRIESLKHDIVGIVRSAADVEGLTIDVNVTTVPVE